MLLRLAPLLMLAACATADYGTVQEVSLPPTAHEWEHGPPWSENEQGWAAPPSWASAPASSWAWGGPALGPWVAAPTVSIGVGPGWWWGYRPWPRYGGWWGGGVWGGFPYAVPSYRPYGWAYGPPRSGPRFYGYGGHYGGPRGYYGGFRGHGWRR